MSKKGDWSIPVAFELRRNLEGTSRAAYENGCSLIKDAVFLFEAGRFPRSTALAILAEEEFAKSFILLNGAVNNRWDSNLYKAIHNHAQKQAFVAAMRDLLDLFIAHSKRITKINHCMLIPIPFAKYPSKEKIEEAIIRGKERINKPVKDYLKQNCFFVKLNREANIQCVPDSIGQEKAKSCIEDAEAFKTISEYQFEENKLKI